MDLIIIALLVVCIGLLILLAVKEFSHSDRDGALRQEINTSVKSLAEILSEGQRNSALLQSEKISQMNQSVTAQLSQFEQRLRSLEETNGQKLEAIRSSVSKQLNYIQEDNNKKLEEIRSTVDEKLQKTLEERISHSFELVSSRLEEVYKGLGEMQSLAAGVGDLKKVLSNVKTRGILGEIQLGAILG
ncbi:MAG: DNA recombination protein RmuC, partial [Oscillospiraceae bacterium]